MNITIFKLLKKPVNLFVMLGAAVLFFDLNYYAMAYLPGSRDNMCVMGAGLTLGNIIFSIFLSLKLGVIVSGLIELHKLRRMQFAASSVSSIGLLFGTLTVFCTACTLPMISVFGAGISMSFFTTHSFIFKIFSVVFLAIGLHMLNKRLIGECELCKID